MLGKTRHTVHTFIMLNESNAIFMLAGILSVVAYSLMQLLFKRSGKPGHGGTGGANPLVLTAWLGLMAPLWLLLLGVGLPTGLLALELSTPYLAYTFAWAGLSVGTMLLMIVILQRVSLTEFTAYRKALVTAGALAADALIFGTTFSPLKLLAIGVVLAASLGLSVSAQPEPLPTKRGKKNSPTPASLKQTLLLMGLLGIAMTVQMVVYKRALELQPDLASHVFLAKGIAAVMSLALFALPAIRKAPAPAGLGFIFAIIACFFVGSVFEAAAIKHLPLTVVMILSMVAATAFAAHDLWRGDLPRKPRTFIFIILVFAGFAALAAVK